VPNVTAPAPAFTLAFDAGTPLSVLSAPLAGEPTQAVTLDQALGLLGPTGSAGSGEKEVRVPASRDSLAEIVNGGVKLPGGVGQLLFVVKTTGH
jgi:hypothetical protein